MRQDRVSIPIKGKNHSVCLSPLNFRQTKQRCERKGTRRIKEKGQPKPFLPLPQEHTLPFECLLKHRVFHQPFWVLFPKPSPAPKSKGQHHLAPGDRPTALALQFSARQAAMQAQTVFFRCKGTQKPMSARPTYPNLVKPPPVIVAPHPHVNQRPFFPQGKCSAPGQLNFPSLHSLTPPKTVYAQILHFSY